MKDINYYSLLTLLFCCCIPVETAEELKREKDIRNIYISYYSGLLRNINSGCKVTTRGGKTDDALNKGIKVGDDFYYTGLVTKNSLVGETSINDIESFILVTDENFNQKRAIEFGSSSIDFGNDILLDSDKNIYVTGGTNGSLEGFSNQGKTDVLFYSFNTNFERRFIKQIGNSENDSAQSLVIDTKDSIYLTGTTTGNFDSNLGLGNKDGFIIKYDKNGNKIWSKLYGTSSNDSINQLFFYKEFIYFVGATEGNYQGNINFGNEDIIISKIDLNGNLIWSKQFGTAGQDIGIQIKIIAEKLFITGGISGSIFGNQYFGKLDSILLELDLNGNLISNLTFGGTGDDRINDLIFHEDNFYFIGNSSSSDINSVFSNGGDSDVFVSKFDKNKKIVWNKFFGTDKIEYSYNFLQDGNSFNLFGITFGDFQNKNLGRGDMFHLRFDTNGNCL